MKIKIFNIAFSIIILLFTLYIVLDTFVLSQTYQVIEENTSSSTQQKNQDVKNNMKNTNSKKSHSSKNSTTKNTSDTTSDTNDSSSSTKADLTSTSDSYIDENINITISTYRQNNTNIYVADVTLSDPKYLKTAFAKSTYGKNVTDTTSNIALSKNAILAINGDYYGVQEKGYVLKNGVIYRNTKRANAQDLVIYSDGSFEIINESDISLEELLEKGAYNVLSFGPAIVENSNISVSTDYEVAKAMNSNPRTAIGIVDTNHYLFVVSDGRTSESEGLSIYELASFMKELGCKTAYNLDGGGSSTMYFNSNVINNPTTNGNKTSERSVSDIVYIGY